MSFILCYLPVGNKSQDLTLLEGWANEAYRKIKCISGKEMNRCQNKNFIYQGKESCPHKMASGVLYS